MSPLFNLTRQSGETDRQYRRRILTMRSELGLEPHAHESFHQYGERLMRTYEYFHAFGLVGGEFERGFLLVPWPKGVKT